MLLGFKRQFHAYILEGSKTHTIRATRRTPPKAGEICHCYGDVRQKTMFLLGRWPCILVQDIEISGGWETRSGDFFGDVKIDGSSLDNDEREQLARRDGFPDFAWMMEFWRGRLPFRGQIIHWDFTRPVSKPPSASRKAASAPDTIASSPLSEFPSSPQ